MSLTASCSSAPAGSAAAVIDFKAPIVLQPTESLLPAEATTEANQAVLASYQTAPRQPEREAVPPTRAPLSQGVWKYPEQHSLGDVLGAVVPRQGLPEMLGGKLVPIINPAQKEIGLVLVWEF
ncbi:MAG: hypothetical protein ACPG31_06800 [Planctomycetota bacterium]